VQGILPRNSGNVYDFLIRLRLLSKSDFNKLFGACLHKNELIQLVNAGFFDSRFNARLAFQHYMFLSEPFHDNNGRILYLM